MRKPRNTRINRGIISSLRNSSTVPIILDSGFKWCARCSNTKPRSAFARNRTANDGLYAHCRECVKRQHRAWYEGSRNKRNGQSWRKRNPGYSTEYGRMYRELNPERAAAANAFRTALRNGTLTRPSHCDVCGVPCKPDGHHPRYDKPLEVVWLCRACHRSGHGEKAIRERSRGG